MHARLAGADLLPERCHRGGGDPAGDTIENAGHGLIHAAGVGGGVGFLKKGSPLAR